MRAQSLPYAPAFIPTPPPTVPGIAHANSNPPSPAARTRWRQTAFAAPPPATSRSFCVSAAARSPPSLSTTASTPSSATSRFEPSPIVATESPRSRDHASASSSSSKVDGCAKARAGPPVPIVVNRARGTPSSTFTLGPPVATEPRGRRLPRRASAAGHRLARARRETWRRPRRAASRRPRRPDGAR